MTCKEIEELIDAYDNKLAEWAEKYSGLQMDLDQERHEKSVLVRQSARAHALLDNADPDDWPEAIGGALGILWAGIYETTNEKTVDAVIAKLGGGTDG